MRAIILSSILLLTSCNPVEHTEVLAKSSTPCSIDILACFHAEIKVYRTKNNFVTTWGYSEDLPSPDFINRWHYILDWTSNLDIYIGRRIRANICGEAVIWPDGKGGMFQEAVGHWRLDLHPFQPSIQKQFAEIVGSRECRIQHFTVNDVGFGAREIYIWETN